MKKTSIYYFWVLIFFISFLLISCGINNAPNKVLGGFNEKSIHSNITQDQEKLGFILSQITLK